MKINFDSIEEKVNPNFKGGEKSVAMRAYDDGSVKAMRIRLEKGASVGFHTHDNNCELMFVLSGTGTVLCDDGSYETVKPGEVSYCAKGRGHSLMNKNDEDLIVYAVVPEIR